MYRLIETHIDINAPTRSVWDVLSDLPAWTEWNPFIPSITGVFQPGARLQMTVSPLGLKPMVFKPRVLSMREGEEITWGGSFLLVVYRGDHTMRIDPLPGDRTRFRQRERFMGPMVLFMGKMFGPTEQGYRAMNLALKRRVESSLGA
ncbi:MAG: SRPBCC domain-containing protein [Bauldia sp.]|nr:SRPBCC domain-containing protein [Bauldia sp.]